MQSYLQKYLIFLILAVSSCGESATNKPDVSDIAVEVKIERFDKELAKLKPEHISQHNEEWQKQYQYFYRDYMVEMLQIGSPKDTAALLSLMPQLLGRKEFIDLNKAVQETFPEMDRYERDLAQSMRYFKYYFPDYKIPRFITFVGGFSYQTPIGEDYVGIGLDMFLGAESKFYPALIKSIPNYISRRFTPDNLVPRVVEAIIREDIFPQRDGSVNTLSHMVYNGKVLYALDCLLDGVSDENKIGYSTAQLQWARGHQQDIWAWFIQENLLYNTDYLEIQKYFSEAPFTKGLGENNESAPKLGSYIGWMIVRKYMDRNPQTSLQELFSNDNSQEILEQSKFKGKS